MPYILRIDSSARVAESQSRRIADHIEKALQTVRPNISVRRRDLATDPVPHIANQTIAGFYTSPEDLTRELIEATSLSDTLIAELKGAEALIISAPIYNFGVPSALKAWIDQIVRINATFAFDGAAFEGLVPTPRAYLALAYGAGGYTEGEPFAAMNFLEPYLVSLMGFLGIADTTTYRVENTTGDADALAQALAKLAGTIEADLTKGTVA